METWGKYGYAKLYFRSWDTDTVTSAIARALIGLRPLTAFDVRRNDDAPLAVGNDFVRWPVVADVEASGIPPATVIVELGQVIIYAWNVDLPVVAACQFEDELPWSGGLQRLG